MIEKILRGAGDVITLSQLKKQFSKLNKKIMKERLTSLENQGKIIVRKNKILWVFTERKKLDSYISKGLEV